MDETKDSNCTLADKLQRLIQNNKLEKLYSETLQKELRSIRWEDFDKFQTNKKHKL